MAQILLIRHGRPEMGNAASLIDPPLSSEGWEQANRVAQYLQQENISRLASSPLTRARQTAEPLAQHLGLSVDQIPGFAEVDGSGAGAGKEYVGLEALRREGGEGWQAFLDDPVSFLGGDPQEFRASVWEAFQTFAREVVASGVRNRAAVFTHGLPINVVLAEVLGIESLTQFVPNYCSVTRFHVSENGQTHILSVNEPILTQPAIE